MSQCLCRFCSKPSRVRQASKLTMQEVTVPETGIPENNRLGRMIDGLAYAISPRWGARRSMQRNAVSRMDRFMKERALSRGGWPSSNDPQRSKSWLTSRLSPDAEADDQLEDMRDQSLSLYKTDPIAHGAIEGRCTNEVGTGLRPQGRVKEVPGKITEEQALQINEIMEDTVSEWSDAGVDRTGVMNLTASQREICRTFAIYGEAFFELTIAPARDSPIPLVIDSFSPRQIETPPDQFRNPLVRLGIEYDKKGRIKGYHKREEEPEDLNTTGKVNYRFIPRMDKHGYVRCCHIKDPVFANQTRGLPWLAGALTRFKDISDVTEATIVAMQIESCFSVFIRGSSDAHEVAKGNSTRTGSNNQRIEDIYPGMVHYLDGEDDDVTFGNPSRPGSSFAPFMEFGLRTLASAIDYPYELLAKDWKGVTYSSGRLSLLDGRLGFIGRRQIVIDQGLKFVWNRCVFEALFLGHLEGLIDLQAFIESPWIYRRHHWSGQGSKDMDPSREVKARVDGVGNDVETMSEGLEERGIDLDDHLRRREVEKIKLVEQNVRVRAHQWQLEETAGLPHEEDVPDLGRPEDEDEDSSDVREPVEAGA